jgi:hypothetical protein
LLEEPETGATGLSPHVPLHLLHLRLDDQVNRFMGCNCHIEETFRLLKQPLLSPPGVVDADRVPPHLQRFALERIE